MERPTRMHDSSLAAAASLLACLACGTGCDGGSDSSETTDARDETLDAIVPPDGTHVGDGSAADALASPDAASLPFVVYVDAEGDDLHDGSTPVLAVETLARVHEILAAAQPQRDVEVRINQGTYLGQSVTWTYYDPARSIRFLPIDYSDGDGIDDIAGRPVFDGQGASFLLRLQASAGEPTNLELIYLRIEHYQQYALHFHGNRNDFASGWNGHNRVSGCYFQDIGNLASAGDPGYGAIDLVNSRDNYIRNNHFVDIENAPGDAGLVHGIYLAHGSSENQILYNRFQGVSGDPIKARDYSNANQIRNNRFNNTGHSAFYVDSWCDMSVNESCTKLDGECPSWENEFRDNEMHCGYDGSSLATFAYAQGEHYVQSWCTDHFDDGWARLYTSGNSKSCP